jgi:hypothetical protein
VSGTVEVVLRYPKTRPHFDGEPLRREPMDREPLDRANAVMGIERAAAEPDLRPSFPLEVFAAHGGEVTAVPEWFVRRVAGAEAVRAAGAGTAA